MKKTLFLLLLIILTVVTLTACKPTEPEKPQSNDESYALFMYMSGTNLESESGSASKTIAQILSTQYSDNVQVYIMTGGTVAWQQHNIPSDSVNIYQAKGGQLNLIKQLPLVSMGDTATLRYFCYLANTVQTDRKVMLLWGHGSPYGICPDQNFDNDMLTYSELGDALTESYFDLIIFNACYTANIDLMTYVQSFSQYAIASEEVLPSLGYNYKAMLELFDNNDKASIADIGKQIIDDSLAKYSNSTLKDTLTLSLINLDKLSQYISDFNIIFYNWRYDINNWLRSLAVANSIGNIGKDLMDVVEHYGQDNNYVGIMLQEIIEYEIHGTRYDTAGLYIYYKENINSYDVSDYQQNCAYGSYYTIVENIVTLKNGKYINFVSSTNSGNGVCDAVLDELAVTYSTTFAYTLYDSDGQFIMTDKLCIDTRYNESNQYTYLSVPEESLFMLTFNGNRLNYSIVTVQETEGSRDSRIIYVASIKVNGKSALLYFAYEFTYDFDNPIYFGQLEGKYSILGYMYAQNGQAYTIEELQQGDVIELDGQSFVFNNEQIERSPLPDDCYISITVNDIYGNIYNTPIYKIKVS